MRWAWLFVALSLLADGCTPADKPTPKSVPKPVALAVLHDADWGRFRSNRHGLSIPFPEGKVWRIDDRTSHWLDAVHPSTNTRVRARTWVEPKPVSREHCEREARRFANEIPIVDPSDVIDEYVSNELFAPDFNTRVVVGMVATNHQSRGLDGYVIAFGAAARRCVAYWYTAQVQGPKASSMLGQRLELGTRIGEKIIFVTRLPKGPLEPVALPPPQ